MSPPLSFGTLNAHEFSVQLSQALTDLAAKEEDIPLADMDEEFGMERLTKPLDRLKFCLHFLRYGALNPAMEKDLKAVRFSFENTIVGDGNGKSLPGFTGLQTHPGGLVFYGLEAGGDWEWPVAFIVYHDGTDFRAYIPQEGNAFNSATRTAYGSEDYAGVERTNHGGRLPQELRADPTRLLGDIEATFGLAPAALSATSPFTVASLPGGSLTKEEFCVGLTEEILINATANERGATPASLRNDFARYFAQHANNPEKTLAFCLSRFLGHGPLNPAMEADFKVIDFDFENVLAGDSDDRTIKGFTGLHQRPNGFVFYGAEAGGDWEYPVAFILYHDGEQFRAYVPQEGNSFNPVTRTAYGSEDHVGAEPHDDPGQLEDELEAKPDVMLADIDRTFGQSTPSVAAVGKTAKGKISTEDCKALLETSTQVLAAGVKGPWKRLKKFKAGGYVVRHFQGTGGFVSVTEDTDGTLAVNQVASTAEALVQPSSPKAPKP